MAATVEPGLDLGECLVTEDRVRRYLEAVGDEHPVYFGHSLAPPVAMTAWALGAILEKLALPDGAIHSSQEFETLRGATFPGTYQITADLGKPRQRGNLVFLTASYSLADAEGRVVQRGKSTVLSPAQTDKPSATDTRPQPAAREDAPSPSLEDRGVLGTSKSITQHQLDAYADASGDRNPLHLDAAFARGTQFGGIIAHGMLTLGFVGELMASAFGRDWLNTGALNVRFRGPAYLGDRVRSWCKVSKPSNEKSGNGNGLVVCSIGVLNERSGVELITGASTVASNGPLPVLPAQAGTTPGAGSGHYNLKRMRR